MFEPGAFGRLRQQDVRRAGIGGIAVVLSALVGFDYVSQWLLVLAAALGAGVSFPILRGWRRGTVATAVLPFTFGVADTAVVLAAVAAVATVRAFDRDRRLWEAAWIWLSLAIAAIAAIGLVEWAEPPALGAACLFASAMFLVDASLTMLRFVLRDGARAIHRAADGAALEGMYWLASSPLALAGDEAWSNAGGGFSMLVAEIVLGLGVWAAYSSLREAEEEMQAVDGLPAQIVAALADVHSETRVRTATILARGAARRLRVPAAQAVRAEAAVALLAADRTLAEVRLRGGRGADALRDTLRAAEEQFDGRGPRGWQGREIPIEGRLAAAVRTWVSLRRGSSESLSADQCSDLLRSQSGFALDPEVVTAVVLTVAELPENLLDVRSPSPEGGALFGGRHLAALSEDDAALLERSPELLVAYFEILSILAGDLNFDHHLQQALRIIRQVVDCEQAGLFLREDDGFVLRHGLGLLQRMAPVRLARDCGFLVEPIVLNDADQMVLSVEDKMLHRLIGGARSAMSAALRAEGRQVGALVLLSSRWSAFRPEQVRFVQLCASRLGGVVASSTAIDRIYREAQSDPVTGLPNIRAAMRRLESEIARASRTKEPLTVLFIDIDRLKPVNDHYGHRAGDRLLAETARRLEGAMRRYDFVARVGGDEFLAIMSGLDSQGTDRRAAQLREVVARRPIAVAHGVTIDASVSVGAAAYPQDGEGAEDLVAVSDQRMYADKRAGRDESTRAASA